MVDKVEAHDVQQHRDGVARGNARDRSFSPSPTRVRDARHVAELAADLVGHLLMNSLSKRELEETLAELVEICNDYGFIGEQELDDPA